MSWWKSLFGKNSATEVDASDDDDHAAQTDQRPPPEFGLDIRIGFSNGERSWEEAENLLECMAAVLKELGHSPLRMSDHVLIEPNLRIKPKLTSFTPQHPSGLRVSTLVFTECDGKIPAGVFEYQYAQGKDLRDALCDAFKGWATIDLPVFIDFSNEKLDACNLMEMKSPASEAQGPTVRRVLLGPPMHMATSNLQEGSEHCFCPCCLLTNSFEPFKELIEGNDFAALRMLAIRKNDGSFSADCRINGEEFEAGKQALVKYAQSWPGTGFDMRKQYVLFEPRRAVEADPVAS